VAGDRRTRRLIEDSRSGQHTLDPAPQPPETPDETAAPPELLETPTPQDASARLEERQKRWFRIREAAIESTENAAPTTARLAENSSSDPKA
jgi:hypothetical protein